MLSLASHASSPKHTDQLQRTRPEQRQRIGSGTEPSVIVMITELEGFGKLTTTASSKTPIAEVSDDEPFRPSPALGPHQGKRAWFWNG
jgi:hypothetical protein